MPVFLHIGCMIATIIVATMAHTAGAQDVDFGRDVQPILSDACFHCHGTDPNTREADLRLDTQEGLLSMVDQSGDVALSELYLRISDEDEDNRMPPVDSHRQLTDEERDTIERWIEQGARWSKHWAFDPIMEPVVPTLSEQWGANSIDAFVMQRLQQENLTPSPAADRNTLLRRVALDLTGLPPTEGLAEVALNAPDDEFQFAYAKFVDSLLDSPAFGERMASVWMEVTRYADSDGYQLDQIRTQYPWRDWVIRAFNDNMPYDQFITEQIAGDLLPDATESQIIATGFNRNHPLNGEGGVDPAETRIEVVADRAETTSTVFLGLTMSCCRCHDHKFDPLTQADYFRMFAYFNNVDEDGRAGHDAKPFLEIKVSPEEREQVEDFQSNTKHHHIRFPKGDRIRVAVMRERKNEPRKTFVLNRGNWNEPTEKVTAGPPEFLPSVDGLPGNRLGLARWITDDSNPLTPRVAVNRFWELFFGRGLVATQEDFGLQGERPSHPQLLDWLANDFRKHGWDVKRLFKQIVLSTTYQQSSVTTPTQFQRDPDNRLLARGSRFRHPSWMLRDQALAISGLLNTELFGPSVRPYQPNNIWFTPTAGKLRYVRHTGDRLYRKSLYTFWRRNIGPTNMFDAGTRRVCEVNVRRTNTPLHALTTLNDVTYVEAARVLAESVLEQDAADDPLTVAFDRVLHRQPTATEHSELTSLFANAKSHYESNTGEAEALLNFGEHPSGNVDPATHAAMTNVALLLLNLDETLCHF
ncbi:planctomycete cytochrome C domain protein [Rhodopirellula sp. SWK7]|nr:planctomycete cytochrome C domain protein [Rhodopirellula sp. SWK7]